MENYKEFQWEGFISCMHRHATVLSNEASVPGCHRCRFNILNQLCVKVGLAEFATSV